MTALSWNIFFEQLWLSKMHLLQGLFTTAGLAFGAIAIGTCISALLAVTTAFGPWWLRGIITVYVYIVRGVPALVTMFFTYYGLGISFLHLSALEAALMALSMYAIAQMTEIMRGAIQSVSNTQIASAKAIGLPFWRRLTDVVAPLAFRRAVPSIVNTAVDVVKASTLVSALGVADLLLVGQQLAARTFFIAQTYFLLWGFYLAVNACLTLLGRSLEERYRHVVY